MDNKITKTIVIFLLATMSITMTGCWDYQELQQRGYVLGIAIDKPEAVSQKLEGGKSKYSSELRKVPSTEGGNPKYAYTIQIPIVSRSQVKPVGQAGGGNTGDKRSWDLTVEGSSFFEASREFATRIDYPAFYEHMQVLVINEDVARLSVSRPIDVMLRDSEMRRKTKVFITPQTAYSILDVIPKIDDYASFYLKNLTNNYKKTARIAYQIDIGQVSENIHSNMDYTLPRVIASKEEIKIEGSSIIKQDKFVGSLDELDTANVEWIKGLAKGGAKVIAMPGNPDELLTLELKRLKSIVRPVINGKSISIKIEVKAEVDIAEQFRSNYDDTFTEAFIDEVQRSAGRKVEHELTETIKYVQDEFGADIFLFNVAMQRYAPDTWDEVKANWSEVFEHLPVDVSATIDVRKRGLIK
jgi:Ger(x)C family germination protein